MDYRDGSRCRSCHENLDYLFVDLGMSPLCQTQIRADQLNSMEPFYPLRVQVCRRCFLVQLDEYVSPDDIFSEYAYFSSYSDGWVAHARRYCEAMKERLDLSADSLVMEVASNDGYLLQHFVEMNIPVVGIEPAANVAKVAIEKGVRTEIEFLGAESAAQLASKYGKADLVLGNNVLAHVPDINEFVSGLKQLLAVEGTITMEFPHLVRLMELNQFDTIYHEHFSYLSWYSVKRVFQQNGLRLFDVEELSTHGGSLRIYACHDSDENREPTTAAVNLERQEISWGINKLETYDKFRSQVARTKRDLLEFLIEQKNSGKSIAGYGAPGKGNTLLNYCGIRTDILDFTVDRNPYKQGTYTPGTHIPIFAPEHLAETKPDYVLILPWNLREELLDQLSYVRDWGGKFVIPIPELEII